MLSPATLQFHLTLSYRTQPRDHPQIRAHLERGYRIVDLQRISDQEAVVTLKLDPEAEALRSAPA